MWNEYYVFNDILIYRVVQFMDLIKYLVESQTVYCQMIIWLKKNGCRRICGWEVVLIKLKLFSKWHQQQYVPHARRRISQIQTSALQRALAKLLAEIRSKFVPSLSWSGVVKKMTYGPGETDTRAISCRQLFTAIITSLEENKETFVRSASPDSKSLM
jgi:hypothetical protein